MKGRRVAGTKAQAGAVSRRRGAELDAALLEAAWDELTAVGYADLTFEGVAARAKTSRPVLSRRWLNREDLVLAALRHHAATTPIEVPDTGALRSDILTLLRTMTARVDEIVGVLSFLVADHFREANLPPSVVREKARVKATWRDQALADTPATMRRILDRAVARGEISAAVLDTRIASLPVDLIRHDLLMAQAPASDEALAEIVDQIFLPAVRAAGSAPDAG